MQVSLQIKIGFVRVSAAVRTNFLENPAINVRTLQLLPAHPSPLK
jgi:hypothetical protein